MKGERQRGETIWVKPIRVCIKILITVNNLTKILTFKHKVNKTFKLILQLFIKTEFVSQPPKVLPQILGFRWTWLIHKSTKSRWNSSWVVFEKPTNRPKANPSNKGLWSLISPPEIEHSQKSVTGSIKMKIFCSHNLKLIKTWLWTRINLFNSKWQMPRTTYLWVKRRWSICQKGRVHRAKRMKKTEWLWWRRSRESLDKPWRLGFRL